MAIKESMLPEFEHHMAITRRLLDRGPAEHAGSKPHPKSMGLGELASHLPDIPFSAQPTIRAESFDPAPPEGEPCRTPRFGSREGAVERYDRNVVMARDAISGTDDAKLTGPSSLQRGGQTMFPTIT